MTGAEMHFEVFFFAVNTSTVYSQLLQNTKLHNVTTFFVTRICRKKNMYYNIHRLFFHLNNPYELECTLVCGFCMVRGCVFVGASATIRPRNLGALAVER